MIPGMQGNGVFPTGTMPRFGRKAAAAQAEPPISVMPFSVRQVDDAYWKKLEDLEALDRREAARADRLVQRSAECDRLACLHRPTYRVTYCRDADPMLMLFRLHEAAHAVVAIRMGMLVQSLCFDGFGGGTGVWFPDSQAGAGIRCIVTAAGIVVNEQFSADPRNVVDDMDVLRVYLPYSQMTIDPFEAAKTLIAEPEMNLAIGRVADLLQPGESLTGEQVLAIASRCGVVSLANPVDSLVGSPD